MSELIQKYDNRATIRWKLLTGASALALAAYVSASEAAKAEDAGRPLIWLELSGGAELVQGTSKPFTADFMFPTQPPDDNVYGSKSFGWKQSPSRFAFGGDAKLTFQPENSDWLLSAEVRYGRSHSKKHTHYQGPLVSLKYATAFSDSLSRSKEQHVIADFSAGRDIGLGLFGKNGSSTLSAGVRFAQFTASGSTHISARPFAMTTPYYFYHFASFDQYFLTGHQRRSFKGVGPSLSWNASAELAGNPDHGQLMLDWGVSAAMLFGRQKTKIDHTTSGYHYKYGTHSRFVHPHNDPLRSRRVTVPELSGFIGLSARLPHSKISIGYKGDIWFGALDRGIDAAKKSDLTFNGPYASISIGLGD